MTTRSISRAVATVRSAAMIRADERVMAGRAGAAMWIIASLSAAALAVILPAAQVDRALVLALAGGGCAWGLLSGLFLSSERLRVWLIHCSTAAGLAAVAVAIAASGGARSPVWPCLFYIVVFSAYFMRPPAAIAYFLACVVVEAVVFLSSGQAMHAGAAARFAVAGPAFVVLGVAVLAGKRYMLRLRREAERLAGEQGALRRVATAVVAGVPDVRFYGLVAVEAAQLIGADAAAILRIAAPGQAQMLGCWAADPARRYDVGEVFPIPPDSDFARTLGAGRPVRSDADAPESMFGRLGYRASMVAPITVLGRMWGCLTVLADDPASLTDEHLRRLTEFTALIAVSITNIEDRAALAAQASTDPLTGVANHRAFQERLVADLARARRYGSPVAVAMIDVDHFKQVNDAGGHEAGDERLVRIAQCLSDAARAEDTLARVGGDEFAWILPETSAREAVVALERVRRRIGQVVDGAPPRTASRPRMPPVTISAGVCDSTLSSDPTELVRLADRALYASKENGRDQVRLYEPAAPAAMPRRVS